MTDQMIAWQVEEWIRDYDFMLREIKRLNRILNKVDFAGGQKMTATYGDEAAMPKGSGGTSQAELRQMDRREKRLHKYESIVHYLDNAMENLEEEKHRIVYDCMMEGMSYTAIANHLDCSRDTVRKIKTSIIVNIVNKVKEVNFLQYLNSFKSAV
ncbi:YjcO [Bacillus atrophaeus UCMB-5137]|uniref:sigma-70 family RNA polymerase sigma factor n=1 Tax=Bacillus atrophaeus TaxID=1452 RepID=UPI00032F528F|nr:sigma-70 family RNA polymerase sigma factor [Bacillus atrophaeus]AKL83267.1 YjcO [Bacillus atrophaeus UCMB-5137]